MESSIGLSKKELRRIPQAEKLRKVMSFQRELIRMMGAWICRLTYPEAKYASARHLWEWAGQVNAIRERLTEMPGGRPDAQLEDRLNHVIEECLFAQDEKDFLEVLYTIVVPEMKQAYDSYIVETKELPDRPTVRILASGVSQLEQQMEEGIRYLKMKYGLSHEGEWGMHIRNLLQLAGGIFGNGDPQGVTSAKIHAGKTYQFPPIPVRQPNTHFTYQFPPIDGLDELFSGDVEVDRVILGVWLYNEMDASEYIPTILYEIKGMPWEFYYDVARHTWDEARHSEFGYRLLPKLGFDPEEFEISACTYVRSMQFASHERYAAVTMWYEPGSFEVKPDFMEKIANEIDHQDLVVELLRFDLADETMHVRFGHKWVAKLMEHARDSRTPEQLIAEVKERGLAMDREMIQKHVRTMPEAQRMTINKIKERIQAWKADRGSGFLSSNI